MARLNSSPITRMIYNTFMKRESTYFTTVVVTGFAFSYYFNTTFDKFWDATHTTQWKDVKHRFIKDSE
ncbi:hypothetical protein AYI69_g102 [Smittium culicis]|uniref:Complex III subunit 9 n=1 Tax=Smittium culicis TaxID=133412 RepID=A0A1R1YTX9_9FUNG|nr:hypothetical protein AYI69_g102 [Smittium culicis]